MHTRRDPALGSARQQHGNLQHVHLLSLGGQHIEPKITDGLAGGVAHRVLQYSLFLEDEWRVSNDFSMTGGMRYDDNQAFSDEWTLRIYISPRGDAPTPRIRHAM